MPRRPALHAVPLTSALVMALLQCILSGASSKIPCGCFFGTVRDSTLCTCDCGESGYMEPSCAFKSDDKTHLLLVTNTTAKNLSNFTSGPLTAQLRTIYPTVSASSSDIFYVAPVETSDYISREYVTYVRALYRVKGSIASLMLLHWKAPVLDANRISLVNAGIQYINVFVKDPAPATKHDKLLLNVTASKHRGLLYLTPLMYLIAIIMILLLSLIDCCCCVTNTTTNVEGVLSAPKAMLPNTWEARGPYQPSY